MTQLSLIEGGAGRVRVAGPVTSITAARAQRGGAEQAIVEVLTAHGAQHADGVCGVLGSAWYPPTIKSAFARLENAGVVRVREGETRLSARGFPQQVYELVP